MVSTITKTLQLGIKYSIRDLISDVSIVCEPWCKRSLLYHFVLL